MRLKAVLVSVFLLLLLPLVISLSFNSGPSINGGGNLTTDRTLECFFNSTGIGTLTADITWYKENSSGWFHWTEDDISGISITDNIEFTTYNNPLYNGVDYSDTKKGDSWICSVTIHNETNSSTTNSSSKSIVNSAPYIDSALSNLNLNEDSPTTLTGLSAYDADGDEIFWKIYAEDDLYEKSSIQTYSQGTLADITFYPSFEDLNEGENETSKYVTIYVTDNSNSYGDVILVTVNAVNDAPIFTNTPLEKSCPELSPCTLEIDVWDEESNYINFSNTNLTTTSTHPNLVNLSNINYSEFILNPTQTQQGTVTFTPQRKHVGTHTYNITLNDSQDENNINYSTLTLTITSVNQPPINITWTNNSAIQNQTENFYFQINATDIDNDEINFTIENIDCDLDSSMWNFTRTSNGTEGIASSEINISFWDSFPYTPNDFVVCRNVTINIFDYELSESRNIIFNITNTNDPPFINDESNSLEIIDPRNRINISNLTAAKGTDFIYIVNATDPDSKTYEGENLTYYLDNETLFIINSTTGWITSKYTINDLYTQENYTLNVTVKDDGLPNLEHSKIAKIHIINNTIPYLNYINDSNCEEDSPCIKTLSANDTDEAENLTLTLNCLYKNPLPTSDWENCSLSPEFVSDNETTTEYKLDFTPLNNQTGKYNLTVTFTDDPGASNSTQLVFNITNVNDPPELDNDGNFSIINNITMKNVVFDILYNQTIYVFDEDLLYNLDNLTFNFSLNDSLDDYKINLTKISESSASLQILAEETDIGKYSINISVKDNSSALDYQEINFTIYNQSLPPDIVQIKPWDDDTVLQNSYTFNNSPIEEIYFDENTTVTFGVLVDGTDDYKYRWYYEENLIYSSNSTNEFSKYFNFSTAGRKTLVVSVEDSFYSVSNFTWIMNIAHVNRPPIYVNPRANLTGEDSVSGTVTYTDFFSLAINNTKVFYDPDDDLNEDGELNEDEYNSLNFKLDNQTSNCNSLARFDFIDKNLKIIPTVVGWCDATFTATDPFNKTAYSNVVRIEITNVDSNEDTTSSSSGSTTITETITVPYQEEVYEPEEFSLVIPGIAAIYENGTVNIPIFLKNIWDEDLSNIRLSANTSNEEIVFKFDQEVFASIPKDSTLRTNLVVENYRIDAPLEIQINAFIESLDFTDTSTIFINALESSGVLNSETNIQTKISFARDLLSDNSECQELTEILNKAEKDIGTDNAVALEKINSVIKACKYLMSEENEQKSELPLSFLGKTGFYIEQFIDFRLFATIFGILVSVGIIISVISKFKLRKI